jgi:Zn-dependent protease
MTPTKEGSIRLFRFAGIDVFLHWSWLVVAFYEIEARRGRYSSLFWNALEYVALFVIVLLHEFGHSLACRQVGGRADKIVLWPLGGVAYVDPPPRPGPTLWSIAAGPLVNVALFFILPVILRLPPVAGWVAGSPDAARFFGEFQTVNFWLLVFNLIPAYPLDGGQILHALLWFGLGYARSLFAATIIGFIGIAVLVVFALLAQSLWMGVLAFFLFMGCRQGFVHARALMAGARRE